MSCNNFTLSGSGVFTDWSGVKFDDPADMQIQKITGVELEGYIREHVEEISGYYLIWFVERCIQSDQGPLSLIRRVVEIDPEYSFFGGRDEILKFLDDYGIYNKTLDFNIAPDDDGNKFLFCSYLSYNPDFANYTEEGGPPLASLVFSAYTVSVDSVRWDGLTRSGSPAVFDCNFNQLIPLNEW